MSTALTNNDTALTNNDTALTNNDTALLMGMKTNSNTALSETEIAISFKKLEKFLRPPTTDEIRIQKDSGYPSKKFANTTWEAVYAAVKWICN